MTNIFIINAHEPYPFSAGRLNQTLVEKATANLEHKGYSIRTTSMQDNHEVEKEIEKHMWADVVILQTPCNWMGVPWTFKKYMDTVYTSGMDGRLCTGDGRTRQDDSVQYGSGGTLTGKKYMISVTFNAPKDAFNNPENKFFAGKGLDDLFLPAHLNFKFFGMTPLETFACYDVLKNPDVENDFKRFEDHLNKLFPAIAK
ncbi:Modulator of drug activity B [Desulfamplus magnetovallimortis]|uniref:Modulator of drug activity B n=1 Tax=Desulfamplus magnetovallimortis TaxID=1246637 RepID=A0A1W1HHR4_9BACT|nr:NAD(P)H-dependent oxidoreductase [Desulfamplus magnetovallimortis]SLM31990.1 Modulator of drug activity B [Desulfamplus magnetovallimortis]